ncbi:hypothetical protein CTAYLR_000070 [Chrysophaeum taylorii]|uniref:Uncharacterized protein n=1 Tax=Chrysophaeum taylorii TaxID=2483200 RepID=A0AAD7UJ50_9STRA|nr:hypothetical protein CTAYLR_000070 [Chrysophaeum taylorii]
MGDFSGREPCPYRILDDVGGAYAMGITIGSVWHFVRGWRNSPKGASFSGAMEQLQVRAPVMGGNFAVWGGLFAVFDCSFAAVRNKEDPWNSIIAGAATGGVLAARAGPKAAGKNALVGGVLLALIEGLGILITKVMAPPLPSKQDLKNADASTPSQQQPGLAPPVPFPTFGSGLASHEST